MADNVAITAGTGTSIATDDIGGIHFQRVKLALGGDGVDDGFVTAGTPLPVAVAGVATEATLAALNGKLQTSTTVPDNQVAAIPMRPVGQDTWSVSFADAGASYLSPEMVLMQAGTGVGYSQAGGALLITTGTTVNAEFLARSVKSWRGTMAFRHSFVASQRIANQNFAFLLADLIGENLTCTINSATSITVGLTAHGFTAQNIGQSIFIGGIAGAAGVPGRYAIASIPTANSINFTVAGWPASGSCTVDLFGHSYVRSLYNGVTATTALVDSQRKGWASGDTSATVLTSATPGHIMQTHMAGREIYWSDTLRASTTAPNVTTRASRFENIPDDNLDLYVFVWSYNGTVAPATTTTWTVGFLGNEKFANLPVTIQGQEMQGTAPPAPVNVLNASLNVVASGTVAGGASTNRTGFVAASGIWYDDSTTVLAALATFTGTARDLTVAATGVSFGNAGTMGQKFRASAESDVSGTLFLEVSRDNTTWRRIKTVATAAVTGGGQYAEIIHEPSWRYARVGFVNGATLQARFTIGSISTAI